MQTRTMMLRQPLADSCGQLLGLKVRLPSSNREVIGINSASFITHILKTGQDGMTTPGNITEVSK